MDQPPVDQDIGQGVAEKPLEHGYGHSLKAYPPQQTPQTHIDLRQNQGTVALAELQIVDPDHFRAGYVDDLLVQQSFANKNFTGRTIHFRERLAGSRPNLYGAGRQVLDQVPR